VWDQTQGYTSSPQVLPCLERVLILLPVPIQASPCPTIEPAILSSNFPLICLFVVYIFGGTGI
jgi:hypothetical protein